MSAGPIVEATVIGHFTGDGRLTVTHGGRTVVDLAMRFMHKGVPQRTLEAVWETKDERRRTKDENRDTSAFVLRPSSLVEALKALLAHPNIASKAAIIRTYDHEIRGGTVVNHDYSRRADVLIDGETVAAVGPALEAPNGAQVIDAGSCYVLPGGID